MEVRARVQVKGEEKRRGGRVLLSSGGTTVIKESDAFDTLNLAPKPKRRLSFHISGGVSTHRDQRVSKQNKNLRGKRIEHGDKGIKVGRHKKAERKKEGSKGK